MSILQSSRFDVMNKNNVKISVVTVVYNGCFVLENTILSVVNQDYSEFEYIIIDGGSTDGTIDIIKKYDNYIYNWVSEKDKGIYDAMNKGIARANGDFIFFLNAGDVLYDHNVFSEVSMQIATSPNYFNTIFLGDIYCYYNNLSLGIVHASNKLSSWYSPPHQGMFIPSNFFKCFFFDLRFGLLADRELLLRIIENRKCPIFILNLVISRYDLSGVSSNMSNSFKLFREGLILNNIYPSSSLLTIISWMKALVKKILSVFMSDHTFYKMMYMIKKYG